MCDWIALPSFMLSKQGYSQIYVIMYILASDKEIKTSLFKLKFQNFLCQFYFWLKIYSYVFWHYLPTGCIPILNFDYLDLYIFNYKLVYAFIFFFFFFPFIFIHFSSVTQLCPTLCNPMNCSKPGLPVHHQLPELTQTHAHRVGDAIQPSHPLLSPPPSAPNPSQHQGLFQWVNSSHEVAKVLEFQLQHQSFQWTPRTDLL